jgi:hypothetical protein
MCIIVIILILTCNLTPSYADRTIRPLKRKREDYEGPEDARDESMMRGLEKRRCAQRWFLAGRISKTSRRMVDSDLEKGLHLSLEEEKKQKIAQSGWGSVPASSSKTTW